MKPKRGTESSEVGTGAVKLWRTLRKKQWIIAQQALGLKNAGRCGPRPYHASLVVALAIVAKSNLRKEVAVHSLAWDNDIFRARAATMFIETGRNRAALAERALWLLLAVLAGLAAYFALRAYLSPELLIYFSSSMTC